MPATSISGSPNITLLDSQIVSDLCLGKFFIDATPSTWIGAGATHIQGIKVKIINPYDVEIKSYGSLFDIPQPATAIYELDMPTQGGKIQYGDYTVSLQLTDENGTTYEVTKIVNVCTYSQDQNPCDDRVQLIASCKNGWLTVNVSEPPVFKGQYAESRTQAWEVFFPTKSGHPTEFSTHGHFSVQLFEGTYTIDGGVCAKYNIGDHVYTKLGYVATIDKTVKCNIDFTCIWAKVQQLNEKLKTNCSQKEKEDTRITILSALLYLRTAELANDAGEDNSIYIKELEKVLGVTCTSDCEGSLPIVNGSPSTNVAFEGCGWTKETVGLTDIYTFDNFEYIISIPDVTGTLSASAPAIDGCTKTQTITYNPANNYTAIKGQIINPTEYNWWASIVNKSLDTINSVCLGIDTLVWAGLTFLQRIDAIKVKACSGSTCSAIITASNETKSGSNVIIDWVSSGALFVEIWVDGVLIASKDSSGGDGSYALYNYADGYNHTYVIKPYCSNAVQGTPVSGSFQELACPVIVAPNVSTNAANGVACPFNLTGLVAALPGGLTAEWHTLNNTLSTSLVPDPTQVINGIYWVFAKDINGCYSTGVQVVVTCQSSGTVTAPQNLQATPVTGSILVRFASAAFPPPSNSYTLKRRLASAPDVDGSYTTLGSTGSGITFNASTQLWELNDNSAASSTLYVYRAISNGGTNPYIDLNYANVECPNITYSLPAPTTIGYSFVDVGGGVYKYEIELYNADGTIFLTKNTHTKPSPAYPNPITGNFPGLSYGHYQVRAKVYVGTFVITCAFTIVEVPANRITGKMLYTDHLPGSGTIEVNSGGTTLRLTAYGGSCGNTTFTVNITGIGTVVAEVHSGNPGEVDTTDIFLPTGTYAFTATHAGGCLPQTSVMTVSN